MWVSWTEFHRVDIMKPISFAKQVYLVCFSLFDRSIWIMFFWKYHKIINKPTDQAIDLKLFVTIWIHNRAYSWQYFKQFIAGEQCKCKFVCKLI